MNDKSVSNDHLFRSSRTGQNIKLPSSISGTELPEARTVLATMATHASDEMMDRICITSVYVSVYVCLGYYMCLSEMTAGGQTAGIRQMSKRRNGDARDERI